MCEADRESPPLGYTAPHTLNGYECTTTIMLSITQASDYATWKRRGKKKVSSPSDYTRHLKRVKYNSIYFGKTLPVLNLVHVLDF